MLDRPNSPKTYEMDKSLSYSVVRLINIPGTGKWKSTKGKNVDIYHGHKVPWYHMLLLLLQNCWWQCDRMASKIWLQRDKSTKRENYCRASWLGRREIFHDRSKNFYTLFKNLCKNVNFMYLHLVNSSYVGRFSRGFYIKTSPSFYATHQLFLHRIVVLISK